MTELIKIVFDISDSGNEESTETLWGEKISEEIGRVDNIPLFVYNLSSCDEVLIEKVSENLYKAKGLSKRSGHSTYRILKNKDIGLEDLNLFLDEIKSIECSYEGYKSYLISIDVWNVNFLDKLISILQKYKYNEVIAEWEEAHRYNPTEIL